MKTIVITGKRGSGKTFLSKAISMGYNYPVWIKAHGKRLCEESFPFISVTPDTDLIIFDDVSVSNIDFVLYCSYLKELQIESKGKAAQLIKRPDFIINLNEDLDVEQNIIERPYMRLHADIIVCQRPYPDDFRFKKFPASMFESDKTLEHVGK